MYLSHPVRRMREDPIEGEPVTLAVRVETQDASGPNQNAGEIDDETVRVVERGLEDVGATVTERLPYGTLRVETTQDNIDAVCTVSHIASIETANALGLGGDAGEDV